METVRVRIGLKIEVADSHSSLALCGRSELHAGVQCEQGNRSRGWRDRGTAAIIHDGVVLVEAGEGVANVLAFAETLEVGGAIVPTLELLQQVPAERRHVSDVRRSGVSASVR